MNSDGLMDDGLVHGLLQGAPLEAELAAPSEYRAGPVASPSDSDSELHTATRSSMVFMDVTKAQQQMLDYCQGYSLSTSVFLETQCERSEAVGRFVRPCKCVSAHM
eukprot:3299788-Pleurochrysis_carterae.AAC.2